MDITAGIGTGLLAAIISIVAAVIYFQIRVLMHAKPGVGKTLVKALRSQNYQWASELVEPAGLQTLEYLRHVMRFAIWLMGAFTVSILAYFLIKGPPAT